jgi:transcriptional regulator with XRE-family HTH domain
VDTFIEWLNQEMNNRQWSYNQLGRQSGLSGATVSLVMTGKQKPSWEFCAGVAEAFGLPPEVVLRKAGLLPAVYDPNGLQELMDIAKSLKPEQRAELTNYARYLFTQRT